MNVYTLLSGKYELKHGTNPNGTCETNSSLSEEKKVKLLLYVCQQYYWRWFLGIWKFSKFQNKRLSELVRSRERRNEKVSDMQRMKCLLICQLQKSWNSAMWDCECGISVTWTSAKKCKVCHDWTLTVILMFELQESQKIGSRFLHSRPCPEKGAPNQVSFSIFCKWIKFNVLAGQG